MSEAKPATTTASTAAPPAADRPTTLQAYARDVVQRLGYGRVAAAVGVILLCTLFESVGLLALIPLLQLMNGLV